MLGSSLRPRNVYERLGERERALTPSSRNSWWFLDRSNKRTPELAELRADPRFRNSSRNVNNGNALFGSHDARPAAPDDGGLR